MARAGGYSRKKSDEYIGTTEAGYAEAIISAKAEGLTLEAWTLDAILAYAYTCEVGRLNRQYHADELKAQAENRPTPERRNYHPTRSRPTPSQPAAGKGGTSGPGQGRSYRP
jgi:hypothetical protein